jgi:hypothetical protein
MRQTLEQSTPRRCALQPRVVAALLGAVACACALDSPGHAGERPATIRIAPSDCAALTAYVADESVDYVPGVDTRGRAVAPADLAGHEPLELDAAEVGIDARIPLAEYYRAPGSLAPVVGDAEAWLGWVTVRGGVAYLGERPLGDPAQAALARACAELLAR